MTTKDEILDALVDDGDIYKFEDGRELRLRIHPDDSNRLEDEEFWGKFAWVGGWTNDYGHHLRPDGFDGNAEKLSFNRGEQVWWQPPSGDYELTDPDTGKPARRGSKVFNDMRRNVLDLLEYGYVGITVELWHSCPTCGTHHEDNHVGLWGIECFVEDDFKREVISDLLDELEVP